MKSGKTVFRLNQAIAKAGICSRRQADELIASGRVALNGNITAHYNCLVDPAVDRLSVDGKPALWRQFTYVAMNKPRGVITTCSDEFGRTGILDLLPDKLRHLRPVGRLDRDSEGLIIITNDGELTQKVTHPLHHLSKRYIVSVKGKVRHEDLEKMSTGLELSCGKTQPAVVKAVSSSAELSIIAITLQEGKNRQIRRMCSCLGYQVVRLVRVAIGGLQLGQMVPGSWRYLTPSEIKMLES